MADKCSCTNPGWCERHKMEKHGRLFELCQMDNATGNQYREMWDKQAIRRQAMSQNQVPEGEQPKPGGCGCRGKSPPPEEEKKN